MTCKNVGKIDRLLRIVVGIGLITATALGKLPVWGWIGVIPLLTGVLAICPAYCLFKIDTTKCDGKSCCPFKKCGKDKEESPEEK